MIKRIIIGAVVGGVVMFIWGAIAWMVLPLHTPTIKEVPNEDELRAILKKNVTEPGFYVVPGWGHEGMTKEQHDAMMKVWEQKHREGPRMVGVLLPQGGDPMMAQYYVRGFALDLLAAFVAAWLLSKAAAGLASYGARVQFVTVTGLFAGIAVHLPYWNWLEFPTDYTIACMADVTIGWLLAGLAIGTVVKPATN
jgi:hypothetical protein